LARRRLLCGRQHVVSTGGVDSQHPDAEVGGGMHGRRDCAWDIVVLKIKKDPMPLGNHSSYQRRTLCAEEATPYFKTARDTLKLVAQVERLCGGIDVESNYELVHVTSGCERLIEPTISPADVWSWRSR